MVRRVFLETRRAESWEESDQDGHGNISRWVREECQGHGLEGGRSRGEGRGDGDGWAASMGSAFVIEIVTFEGGWF
jgi:hypothetical protein